jgi:hypothetical protein
MPDLRSKARKFYDFATMRLSGKSDICYRAYDLLRPPERGYKAHMLEHSFERMAKHAGLEWAIGRDIEVLETIQAHFRSMGFGKIYIPGCRKLVREYYIYSRLQYGGMQGWTMRDPDESAMIYEAHIKACAKDIEVAPERVISPRPLVGPLY